MTEKQLPGNGKATNKQAKRGAKKPEKPTLTRDGIKGLRVCIRGTFQLGAAKDIERKLKELGAKVTKFWTKADVIFCGKDGKLQPYYEGYAEARHKQATEQQLAAIVGDLQAVREERTKKESPSAQRHQLHPADAAFRKAFWADPNDLNALKVWADSLIDRGDVRGEFIQLSLDDELYDRASALRKKLGAQLVGPARPFIRTFDFDSRGLVKLVTAEAPRVVEGFDLIAALHPRLCLTITSLRTKTTAVIAELVKHPLGQVHMLDLGNNGLTDTALVALAPALTGVKWLSLAHNDVTGEGLEAMAPHLTALEGLELTCSQRQLASAAEAVAGWVNALTRPGHFPSMKALALSRQQPTPADRARLESRFKFVGNLYDEVESSLA